MCLPCVQQQQNETQLCYAYFTKKRKIYSQLMLSTIEYLIMAIHNLNVVFIIVKKILNKKNGFTAIMAPSHISNQKVIRDSGFFIV